MTRGVDLGIERMPEVNRFIRETDIRLEPKTRKDRKIVKELHDHWPIIKPTLII